MSMPLQHIGLPFSPADRTEALRLGRETHAVWASRPGHYRNSLDSHERGKCGEIACLNWLRQELPDTFELFAAFEQIEDARLCDVIVAKKVRIEVKCWNSFFWPSMGRCIAVNQVDDVCSKADYIFWALSNQSKTIIDFVGWSTVSDVRSAPVRWTGPTGKRQVQNHQLDDDALRTPATFLQEILDAAK